MITFLLSLSMLASIAAGVFTPSYDRDMTQDQTHLQDQDRLHDGSCKL